MLKSIKLLYGKKLRASDGEIGQVKDFYFDDQNWAVRYVVADTGTWLFGQLVLLAPHAFVSLHQSGNDLSVNLTRQQIENSPSIESHKPLSRQYEEDYYKYYGWPYYWQGNGLWGMGGFPGLQLATIPIPCEPPPAISTKTKRQDAHLRCTQAVEGYNIKASDGTVGRISDFIIDSKSWAIRTIAIKIGHLLSAREVEIPVSKVDRISYDESMVYVSMTIKAVEESPEHHQISKVAAD